MTSFVKDTHPVSFFGRPFGELLTCFGLAESDLIGRSVLECPSGPSSFVAEASRKGIAAIGIDPLFYRGSQALRRLAESDFEEMFCRMRANATRFVARTYRSIEEAEALRREALEAFLRDYETGRALGRYRLGALPELEFADQSFDLVLCAHFLFIYAERFDVDFHHRALRELCRVARREVRIHPIVDGSSRRYGELDRLAELAGEAGFDARIEDVDHEFFAGANQTLVLTRA